MRSAVILAAGEGRGAWPFCGIRQKVTVPVANVPLVRRLAVDLLSLDIQEVAVVIGHRGEAVRSVLGDLDAVRFVAQSPLKGPADAALHGLSLVSGEDVLVCHGDVVTTRETLATFLDEWRTNERVAAMLVADCPPDAPRYISVHMRADGLVERIVGRGDTSLPRFAGIVAAPTDLLRRYLLRNPGMMESVPIGAMPPVEGEIAESLEQMRRDGHPLRAVRAEGFVVDADRPWDILQGNSLAAAHAIAQLKETVVAADAHIDDGADIAADAKLMLGAGARIGKGTHIGGSAILGPGAQVIHGAILGGGTVVGAETICRDYCTVAGGSVLGARCIFGHGSEFEGVTFDTVYLWHYCEVCGLLGSNVDIGAATVCGTWRFDEGVKAQVVNGHRERPAAFGSCTYIGDHSRTGVNAVFMPGVKVGWYACVGAGAIVYEDVPERTLLIPKQKHVLRPWGPEKYGW